MHSSLLRALGAGTATLACFASLGCGDAPAPDGSPDVTSGGTAAATGGDGNGVGTGGSLGHTTGGSSSGGGVNEPEWELVWFDEFEGTGAPDASKWNFETQGPGWVNNELQAYVGSRSENVRLENGSLVIEARRDFHGGNEYSSARIHTAGKGDFTYGRFEARAKLPAGLGTWPAIWMMPTNPFRFATTCTAETGWISGCDAWPNSGEIDIMEHVGYDPNVVHATIHCQRYNWLNGTPATAQTNVSDVFGTFHVYAIERTPDAIYAFVDDQLYFTYEKPAGANWQLWPFDEPFHFIVNIAVGGAWGGKEGVDPAVFPARLEIDYLRVYQRPL